MLSKLGVLFLFTILSFQTKRTPIISTLILVPAKVSVGKEQNTLPLYIYASDCQRFNMLAASPLSAAGLRPDY